ncbi:MAG: hypothetical protein QF492_01465 [Candidatus Krumholzibacteria bacterium]|jgi:hypothetical protein|nr:hypothetical protein [Candidatus Krumholzibacteria bacterium]MDP6668561.1 hypothetical protein [Candidatus Krumholzibacteria bacterium]MDP6796880.1 hypothetical protein [Candidatus Krumholzibacteria bacterium]MDP7021813.1 hypothetical protein [Candidatus Krumholzibacteria bacterium]
MRRLAVLLLIVLGLSACDCPEAPIVYPWGIWYLSTDESLLPRIESLAELADTLETYGLALERIEGLEYRFGFRPNQYDSLTIPTTNWINRMSANKAAYLHDIHVEEPTADSLLLLTHAGLQDDSLQIELLQSRQELEDLLQIDVRSFSIPNEAHDMRTLHAIRNAGYHAARTGNVNYEPWGAFLLGRPDDPIWNNEGWEHLSIFELSRNLTASEIQSLALDEVDDWLAESGRLEHWKEENLWVHLYTRTDNSEYTSTQILDGDHLAALMDALLADGDVWIASMGEVSEYVRSNHVPILPDSLRWDAVNWGEQPWNGKACVFTFSTDDGYRSNHLEYTPNMVSRGLSYTCFLNPRRIGVSGDYLNTDDIQAMVEQGIEIGSRGLNYRYLLPDSAGWIHDASGNGDMGFEIRSEGSAKVFQLLPREPEE